jgi:tRNA wybutosine-synthesizing protein 4
MMIGGIVKDHLLPYETEITLWNTSKGTVYPPSDRLGLGSPKHPAPRRALLVGHSALLTKNGQVAILGGGATCFSMGTYWNKGPYTLNFPDESHDVLQLQYHQTVEILPEIKPKGTSETDSQGLSAPKITPIPQVLLQSAADFDGILRKGQPVVLKNLDLGSCVTQWNLNYIAEKAGAERKVGVELFPNKMRHTNRAQTRLLYTSRRPKAWISTPRTSST